MLPILTLLDFSKLPLSELITPPGHSHPLLSTQFPGWPPSSPAGHFPPLLATLLPWWLPSSPAGYPHPLLASGHPPPHLYPPCNPLELCTHPQEEGREISISTARSKCSTFFKYQQKWPHLGFLVIALWNNTSSDI